MLYNNQAAMVFDTRPLETNRIAREGSRQPITAHSHFPTDHKPLRRQGRRRRSRSTPRRRRTSRPRLLFAVYVARPEIAPVTNASVGYPSATKGILPPENVPIQRKWAEWTQGEVGFYRLTDQGLPQNVVASYFEAQDSVILGAMKPAEAAEQVQKAITRFKKRNN